MLYSPGSVIIDLGEILNLNLNLQIRWYGLLIGLGFLLALIIIHIKTNTNKINEIQKQNLFDLIFICFFCGIISARLWFVILKWEYFAFNPIEIVQIWKGGQSIQGGIIGGVLSALLFYWFKKTQNKLSDLIPLGEFADLMALGLPIGQAIGRWGNFFNMEAFGQPTNLPFGQFIPPELRPSQYLGYSFFHPMFLYESIYLLIIFCILFYLYDAMRNDSKRDNFTRSVIKVNITFLNNGSLFPIYIILYSVARFFLEFLRLDSLLISVFPAAQIICLIMISISILFLIVINKRHLYKVP